MPEIYMDHPEHGATCVFDNGAADNLKQYGWKVRGEVVKAAEKYQESAAAEIAALSPKVSEPKKRGPKPKAS